MTSENSEWGICKFCCSIFVPIGIKMVGENHFFLQETGKAMMMLLKMLSDNHFLIWSLQNQQAARVCFVGCIILEHLYRLGNARMAEMKYSHAINMNKYAQISPMSGFDSKGGKKERKNYEKIFM